MFLFFFSLVIDRHRILYFDLLLAIVVAFIQMYSVYLFCITHHLMRECVPFSNLIIIFHCIIIHHRYRRRQYTFYAQTNWWYKICAVCRKLFYVLKLEYTQTNHSFSFILVYASQIQCWNSKKIRSNFHIEISDYGQVLNGWLVSSLNKFSCLE